MQKLIAHLINSIKTSTRTWISSIAILLLLAIALVSAESWMPGLQSWLSVAGKGEKNEDDEHAPDDSGDSLVVSDQAKRNLGLIVGDVQLRKTYSRKLSVPGMVTSLPGKTHFQIASPMTGVVTEIAVLRGQSVWSDELLFRLRLSHEDLVRVQTDFLRTLGELDAEKKEIARLKKIAGGAVAERLVLERQYARDKLTAIMRAQEEALHLHGLSDLQIRSIIEKRRLVQEVTITVPQLHQDHSLHFDRDEGHVPQSSKSPMTQAKKNQSISHSKKHRFFVEQLPVQPGQLVKAGDTLCVLADYQQLYIEGRAFEQDADYLVNVAQQNRMISAVPETLGRQHQETIDNLSIIFVANEIDSVSRALYFYVGLPNELSTKKISRVNRFLSWKYRPGQRMQIRVPVEVWKDVIVLPVDAVAQEGPEFYVFVENGKRFVRRAVSVKYRDQFEVVLDYDGSISPGDRVAMNSAHQLLIALKNQAGGAVDPHAGHSH